MMKKIFTGLWGGKLQALDSVPSTNAYALEHITELRHGDIVSALDQTAGKGRFGRDWYSDAGKSVTLSVVLEPASLPLLSPGLLMQATALAVRSAVDDCGVNARIRWPNDVESAGGKLAGILAEMDDSSGMAVLGIGINVNQDREDFSGLDIARPAASILVETGRRHNTALLTKVLIGELETFLEFDASNILKDWRRYDALRDSEISVSTPQDTYTGRYKGISDDGRLILEDAGGEERLFWSGDVTLSEN